MWLPRPQNSRNAYKTREIQQDHTWPRNRYWPQIGQKWPQNRRRRQKDKWFHFHAATPPPRPEKSNTPTLQARKKSTKINFLGPETARGGEGLPREGAGVEKLVPSLESFFPWVSREGIWDVPGILPGCPAPLGVFKKFVPKKFVRMFRPLTLALPQLSRISWDFFPC